MSNAVARRNDKRIEPVKVENARIIFRNFEGAEGQYNRAGDRNFGLVLEHDVAEAMKAEGWNVKYLRPREEGDEPQPWLPVSVSYKGRPPMIVMVTSRGKTMLPEELVMMLDWADFANVDLIVNPYQWNVNGNSGVKAYLKSIYVTIVEDELELKYADVQEIDLKGSPVMQIGMEPHDDDIIDGEVVEDEQDGGF